ncbi:hypothetical protein NADFUDRAFT_50353 [Nadsonia fulvescens var. elongata DSM 6958]|uniref:Uncharacterized protein n=1 Tax=Nadsonia fulvescens var. elongata DSM 6958 TaxID=857566 RepID=A0A1E3PLX2_9ASCO|nr:hypothetical protein NADFUDRAFT_50353 [Nadsonia fulvescens var. elongata DSM 6958]
MDSLGHLDVEAKLAVSFNSIMIGTGHLLTYMSTTAGSQRVIHNPSMQIQDSINRSVETFDVLLDTAALNLHKVRLGLEQERAKREFLKRKQEEKEKKPSQARSKVELDGKLGGKPEEISREVKEEPKEGLGGEQNGDSYKSLNRNFNGELNKGQNEEIKSSEFASADDFMSMIDDKSEVKDDNFTKGSSMTVDAPTTTITDNDKDTEKLDNDLMMMMDFGDIPGEEETGTIQENNTKSTAADSHLATEPKDGSSEILPVEISDTNNDQISQFHPVEDANEDEIEMGKNEDLDDMFFSMDNDAKNIDLGPEGVNSFEDFNNDDDNNNNNVNTNNISNAFSIASKDKFTDSETTDKPLIIESQLPTESKNVGTSEITSPRPEPIGAIETPANSIAIDSESLTEPISETNQGMDMNMDVDIDMNADLNMIDTIMDTADGAMPTDAAIGGLFGEDFDFVIP